MGIENRKMLAALGALTLGVSSTDDRSLQPDWKLRPRGTHDNSRGGASSAAHSSHVGSDLPSNSTELLFAPYDTTCANWIGVPPLERIHSRFERAQCGAVVF